MRCTAEREFDSMTIPVVNNAEVGAHLRSAFEPMVSAMHTA
jgi:hypothetical protein